MQPDLSVIIVSHNTRELLLECLVSLSPAIDWPNPKTQLAVRRKTVDITVVDNASTDSTSDIVQTEFPVVHLIRNSENRGFAAAANQGIRATTGRYILLLNADTIVCAGSLDALLDFLETHPQAGAVGLQLLNSDGSLQPSGRAFLTIGRALMDLVPLPMGVRVLLRPPLERRDYSLPSLVDEVSGAALALRRAALDQVGLLCEDFFFFGEDVDLCWRLWEASWQVWYLPSAQVVHHWGKSRTSTGSVQISLWAQRATYLLIAKHRPAWQALSLKATLFLITTLKLARHLIGPMLRRDWAASREVWALHIREIVWLWHH